jgi:hypothetical protein
MFFWSADANTSAGAPCAIWVSRSDDDPKLNVILVPGFAASNSAPSVVKPFVNDDAASTVMPPWSFGSLDVVAPLPGDTVVAAVPFLSEPHAEAMSPHATKTTLTVRSVRTISPPGD